MTINDFHAVLDPRIVERGRSYFLENAVLELVKEDVQKWTAVVAGTEEYEIEILLKEAEIQQSQCSCPYDHGLTCKHEVAVFFAIREDLKREAFATETGLPQKMLRSLPFPEQVMKVGLLVEKSELLDFIAQQGETDRGFREAFLIRFGDHLGEDRLARIRRMVDHTVRSAAGSKAYLALRETESVADALRELWKKHQQSDIAGEVRNLIREAVNEARKSAEDFEGYLKLLLEELEEKK